jgi:hypothetical protein
MSPRERKMLEDKRQQLHNEQMSAIAKANQAQGAIAMIDSILAMPDEQPETTKQVNGADTLDAHGTHQ